MKNNVLYFSNDCNARRDPKVLNLRADFGAAGYGYYFMLIEMLREEQGYLKNDEPTIKAISFEFALPLDETKRFIEICVELNLLSEKDGYLYSPRLLESIEHLNGIRNKRKEAIEKRWKKEKVESLPAKVVELPKPEKEITHPLQDYIKKNCPRLSTLKKQLTYSEALAIKEKYPDTSFVMKVLENLENYKPLTTKYIYVYRTLNNWLKKEIEYDTTKQPTNKRAKGDVTAERVSKIIESSY